MDVQTSLNFRLIVAIVLTFVGSGLLIAGFIVPPTGIISSSVLIAYGETCTFIGAILGIDYSYQFRSFRDKRSKKNDDEEKNDKK